MALLWFLSHYDHEILKKKALGDDYDTPMYLVVESYLEEMKKLHAAEEVISLNEAKLSEGIAGTFNRFVKKPEPKLKKIIESRRVTFSDFFYLQTVLIDEDLPLKSLAIQQIAKQFVLKVNNRDKFEKELIEYVTSVADNYMIEKGDTLVSVSSLLLEEGSLIEESLKAEATEYVPESMENDCIDRFYDTEDEKRIGQLVINRRYINPEISLAILIFAHYSGKISIREIEWDSCSQWFDVKFYLPQNKLMYQNFTDRIFSIKCGKVVDDSFTVMINEREDLTSRIKMNKSSKILYDIAHSDIHTYEKSKRAGVWSSIKYISGTDAKKTSEFYKLIEGRLLPTDLFIIDDKLGVVASHPKINILPL